MAAEPGVSWKDGPYVDNARGYVCYTCNPFNQRLVHICPHLAVDSRKLVGCCVKLPGTRLRVGNAQVRQQTVVTNVYAPDQCPYLQPPAAVSDSGNT